MPTSKVFQNVANSSFHQMSKDRIFADQKSQINSELQLLDQKLIELEGSAKHTLITAYKEMVLERIKVLNQF